MSHKAAPFTPRLVVFNETFTPLVKKGSRGYGKKPLAVLWYEAEAGRDAENVTAAFWHYLQQNRNKKRIIIYADNCSAQQKLWPQKVVTQKRLRYQNHAYVFAEYKVIEKNNFGRNHLNVAWSMEDYLST